MNYQISEGILSAVMKNQQRMERDIHTISAAVGTETAESIMKSYESIKEGKFVFSRGIDIFTYLTRIMYDALSSQNFTDYEKDLDELEKSNIDGEGVKDILSAPSKNLNFIDEFARYGKKETGKHQIVYEVIPDKNIIVFHSILALKKHYRRT